MNKPSLTLFEGKQIRRIWDEKQEKWLFSVVDIVGTLSNSSDSRKYWNKLKQRLKEEGSELVTFCLQLKLMASDGKNYKTDVADTESIFRLIQSIPSPNAEPFKLWLARIGYERIEESENPELAINRALNNYLAKGYSEDWINQRLKSIEIRKQLTNEWKKSGVLDKEYGILTDEITRAWAGISTKDYKGLKGLKKESLRDNMNNLELILNMLAEASTTEINKAEKPKGLIANKKVAKKGGTIAGNARKQIEKETGKSVLSKENNLGLRNGIKQKSINIKS